MKLQRYSSINSFDRSTVRQVVERWAAGHDNCCTANRSIWSEDGRLWSYNLCIGFRSDNGDAIVADYTATGGAMYSVTTSTHVNLAKRAVGDSGSTMTVEAWKLSPLFTSTPF
jgi:hypothetical protein